MGVGGGVIVMAKCQEEPNEALPVMISMRMRTEQV